MKILVNGIEKPGELETLLCHAVKGGGQCQKRTYLQFSRDCNKFCVN